MNSPTDPPAARGAYALVTALTLVRMPLAAAFAGVLLVGDRGWTTTLAAVALLTLSEISDGLDGYLARRLGAASRFGALLDPYSDSISRITIYWALAATDRTFACVPLVLALRDVTVAYCRILWIGANRSGGALLSGKLKAIVQGVGAFTLILWPHLLPQWPGLAPAMSWAVIVVTLLSLVEYVGQTLPLLREPSR